MTTRYRKHRLLVSLCCISLIACLWLANVTSNTVQIQIGEVVNAQNSASSQWVKNGVEKYQAGEFLDAIEDWNKALDIEKNNSNPRNKAIILENLARAYQQVGQTENTLKDWEEVVFLHRQLGDIAKVGRSLTELAQVYSSYGQPKKAIALLCNPDKNDKNHKCQAGSAFQIAQDSEDIEGKVAALGSLGEAYRLVEGCEEEEENGKCKAITYLDESLKTLQSEESTNKNYEISVLNSLGNVYISRASLRYRRAFSLEKQGEPDAKTKRETAEKDDEGALENLRKSYQIAQEIGKHSAAIRALLTEIPIYYRLNRDSEAQEAWKKARELLKDLPRNSQTAYIYIDLADKSQRTIDKNGLPINLSQCSQALEKSSEIFSTAENLLKQAANIANQINDSRAKSFALGKLGKLYECRNDGNDLDEALKYTKKARDIIEQNLTAKDSLFLWEWQTARIFNKQSKTDEAIVAYKNARYTLETVRQNILNENRNFQFDFRDEVEPIYRELLALQLNAKAGAKENKSNSDNHQQDSQDLLGALETMDALKIWELQNYLGNDCVLTIPEQNSKDETDTLNNQDKFKQKILSLIAKDKQTAILSSIILEDKTAIILTLPNEQPKIHWINKDEETVRDEIINYRRALEKSHLPTSRLDFLGRSKKFYDEIVKPFEKYLNPHSETKYTLVFAQDGIFQSIPMSSLFDESHKEFLIQKYAIAYLPSISLIENTNFKQSNFKVLALGVSEKEELEGEKFKTLRGVKKEIDLIPNNTPLINENFNRNNLKKELNKQIYSVIHIATHGQAGAEAKDTFIVTGETDPEKRNLGITELDSIIRDTTKRQNQIDLLAITACESAVGDDRSSLGLAGIAVQAGAKSTLASLWSIDDESTAILSQKFYTDLNNHITKAQALRNAQIKLIEDNKQPSFWAPFILVGNWQ